jgi:hypothetical protein
MAIIGNGGILELSREWPEPRALAPNALNISTATLSIDDPQYWTGDRIILAAEGGLPIDGDDNGFASNPGGQGIYYGSIYDLGPARVHVTAPSANYYQATNTVPFYNTATTTGLITQVDAYINMDDLDRAKLYKSAIAAYNADSSQILALKSVNTENLVITRYNDTPEYSSAIDLAASSIKPLTLPSSSQKLEDVITVPSGMTAVASNPDSRGWLVQCDLQEWALSVDASNLDMTAIGETFGENTKSLVRGAGSLTFLVDQRHVDRDQSSTTLLRLVMLTEKQAKSSAKFYLFKDRNPVLPQVGSTAYYDCDILLTNTRIDVKATDIISGTSDFVATGEIAIKFEP